MSNHLLSNIGKRIKHLRLQQNYKLVETAEKAGISKGLLSKIENGRTMPSLPVLISVIQALNIHPEKFFSGMDYEPQRSYILQKANDQVIIQKEEHISGFQYKLILNQTLAPYTLEAVILELEPGAKRAKVSTDAYEFKYILQGPVDYVIGDELISMDTGDSLLFDGTIPHVPFNPGDEIARMLVLYFYHNQPR